jgi:hypothetical protein
MAARAAICGEDQAFDNVYHALLAVAWSQVIGVRLPKKPA